MADLTDTEIVAACARAIGVQPHPKWNAAKWPTPEFLGTHGVFNPLADRAQALELVEKLRLRVIGSGPPYSRAADPVWIVEQGGNRGEARDTNLLRAICLCAARVQVEKEKNANG